MKKEMNNLLYYFLITLLVIGIIIGAYFTGYNNGSEMYRNSYYEISLLTRECLNGYVETGKKHAICEYEQIMLLKEKAISEVRDLNETIAGRNKK